MEIIYPIKIDTILSDNLQANSVREACKNSFNGLYGASSCKRRKGPKILVYGIYILTGSVECQICFQYILIHL